MDKFSTRLYFSNPESEFESAIVRPHSNSEIVIDFNRNFGFKLKFIVMYENWPDLSKFHEFLSFGGELLI